MSRTRYGLALASAATLATLSCGGVIGAAVADPGGVPHQGNNGKHVGAVKHGDKDKDKDKGDKGKDHAHHPNNGHATGHANGHANGHGNGQANGHANGHAHAPGQQGSSGGAHGDPPGNNGTVKIAGPGDEVGHPSNNPHPGCTFFVEWFGYDAGDDVVSTVTFTPQAPTSDITISGTDPSSVFVGGDAAGGGTDLDGRQAYTLSFTGTPHPKQGYHVKLTVATPRSLGNDTKTKVFWVEPCTTTPESDTPSESPSTAADTSDDTSNGTESSTDAPDTGVLGTEASAPAESAPDTARAGTAAVPTSVDAGESNEVLPEWARSPIALAVAAGGLVLLAVAIARRVRHGA